jgi:uncharacterized membrane protein YjjP (DUF1212 family)
MGSLTTEERRRAVRLALRLGVAMLASGAQAQEVETSLLDVTRSLGLVGADAIVTNSSVTVSHIAPGDAEATTAIQAVREWRPDFGRLAACAALVSQIRDGRADLDKGEAELDRIVAMEPPYARWLRFAAPALLSGAITIVFGGSSFDALVTFLIGLAIQPALEGIERSALPLFFQVVFGVAATTLLVILLVGLGLPIDGGLVLTGGLLRFLPGAQLVAGMRDLIARAIVSGAANLAEVILLGIAVAGSASLVLAFGETFLGIVLRISEQGRVDWPALVIVAAGAGAVAAYCVRLGVPPPVVLSAAILGGVAVAIANGLGARFDRSGSQRPNASRGARDRRRRPRSCGSLGRAVGALDRARDPATAACTGNAAAPPGRDGGGPERASGPGADDCVPDRGQGGVR